MPAWARLERQTVQGAESCTRRGAGACVRRPRTEGSMRDWELGAIMVALTLVLAAVMFAIVQELKPWS